MAEKTIVDKAGETVGVGIAMASDVAGAIKTAFGAAVTTVTDVL
jgi:ribosomal protein S5